jgi:AcrR family transcriptional regulator
VLPGRLALPLGATACRTQLLPRPRALPTEPHAGSMVSPRRGQQRTASAVVRSSYSLTIRATRRGDGGVRHLGDRRARVDRIPEAARVNKAQMYGWFGSKDGLFEAVLALHLDRIVDAVSFTPLRPFGLRPRAHTTPTSPTPSSCGWRAGTGLSASRPASCSPPTGAAPNQARGDRARPSRGRDRRGHQARRRLRAHRRARRHVVADQRHVHRFARGERRRA